MSDADICKTLIIGSGPAGLTAGIYAARANLNPIILAGNTPGGQLTKTSLVENYPGFKKGVNGPELMMDMLEQVRYCGGKIIYENAESVDVTTRPFTVKYGGGQILKTHTLVYSTGAAPRWLGVPGEREFAPPKGSGVTTCAVCDGSFYRNLPVAVVGGGDSAMEEANYLAKLCSSVTVIHRRAEFRASKIMLERARANPVIHWELNQMVEEIIGDPKGKPVPHVAGIKLRHVLDSRVKELAVSAVFVAVGHIPEVSLLRNQVVLDNDGYISVDERQRTSIQGLFAAGDCHDYRYRQAITAAGMGCKAALEVERYLIECGL